MYVVQGGSQKLLLTTKNLLSLSLFSGPPCTEYLLWMLRG